MRMIACPYCLGYSAPPPDWQEVAFLCGHCKRTVNTADALPAATPLVQHVVFLVAVLVGLFVTLAESSAAGPRVARDGALTLKLVLTFWGTVYVTAILSFRYLRMAADALGVRRELRGLLLFLNIPGGLLLIVTGGEALINAIELRPSFVVGVLTFWFALRGVSRTKGANRTYAGRWGDNTTVGGGSPRLRVEPPPPCSESVARTLALARSEALAHGQAFVGTHHLLIALARPECGWTGEAFAAQGVTPGRLRVAFSAHLEREAVEVPAGDLPITPAVRRAVEQAETAAKAIGLEGATPEQLLLVLLGDSKSIVSDTLVGMGIDPNRVRESLMNDQPPSSKV